MPKFDTDISFIYDEKGKVTGYKYNTIWGPIAGFGSIILIIGIFCGIIWVGRLLGIKSTDDGYPSCSPSGYTMDCN